MKPKLIKLLFAIFAPLESPPRDSSELRAFSSQSEARLRRGEKIFAFLVCIFGFWFLSFDFAQAGWTSGKYGSAIQFDGINDYVNSNSSLAAASAFSYSLWFKSSDGSFAADEYLFSQGTNDPSVYLESTDNKLKVMADGADKLSSAKTVNNAQWHHLEITADGTNLKLYLDGGLESSIAYTGSSAAGILYVASNATPGSYFGGIIDDVKIYSYARTSDEVLTDYNDGKAAHLGKDSQRDDGLVGYWNMEEGKGQTVYDRSGNANNGTLGASTAVAKDDPVFTSGYSSAGAGGTGLKFDGVDDYVDAGSGTSLNNINNFTIESWINPSTMGSLKSAVSKFYQFELDKAAGATNKIMIVLGSGTGWRTPYAYSNTYTIGQWAHFVGTWDGTNLKMYHNGVLVESVTPSGGGGQNTNPVAIGRPSVSPGSTEFFNGSIDEVRIYNRALSADEIRQHYNQKKPILELRMDEGSGTSAKDESFNNNDGTLYSGATVCSNPPTAGCPTWAQGKYGSALSFDGTNDYVNAGSNLDYITYSSFTLEAWVKISNVYTWYPDIISTYGSGISYFRFRLYTDTGRPYGFYQYSGITWGVAGNSTTNVKDNNWHHLVYRLDRSTTELSLYVDGKLDAKITNMTGSGFDTADPLKIGNSFPGLIDSVRVYNYARTPAEILVDYNNGLAARLR